MLAAGSGRRFGSDKLLHALPNGELMAVQACRNLLAGVDKVLAVVRPGNEVLVECLKAEGAVVEVCLAADQGMGASLAFGVGASASAFGWLIALADMPSIAPTSIVQVANALRTGELIAAPSYQGRRGHPVGFSSDLYRDLISLSGDIGAKSLLQSKKDQVYLVKCNDPGILMDIDQPDDLKLLNHK
ncbi:molybdopterin-guanine dinucleotide biosynthesis protein MobA [Methyloprofundus sedimenti]|uniref:Molybdopterin-guanine dinucleotide biosynthesis protein MobA n=1 Tax=Methyloprofundus sedimenti TaxID=1420851 RepID=A0A1V8MAQ8_9GAMM|nr:molybdopterin-guanine dinucleotide biosynthesis protein MobA [Methyloprofundus sedimenti]